MLSGSGVPMRVIGMMSGTSFDGIDVAVADLDLVDDGVTLRRVGELTHRYPDEVRDAIAATLPPEPTTAADLCILDTLIGQAFAGAAGRALEEVAGGRADLVVSHGQTVYHWVEERQVRGSLQLGQPAWIAERTGLPVVADLRAADIARGGQGAPLVSILDVLLLGPGTPQPRAALNLGGIANLTVVGGDIEPVAFDTGPANALLDVAVVELTGGEETFDRDGRRAASGQVDGELLDVLLSDDYYALAPPKSTGKERFHLGHLRAALGSRPIDLDVLATLVELTARTVADWCHRYDVVEVVAAGGGVDNPTLMAALDRQLDGIELRRIEEHGLPSGEKEAYLFALLGFLSVHGLPGTVPSCTGARGPSILGAVIPGEAGLPRITPAPRAPTRLTVLDSPISQEVGP
jgi:anhydro-N-acetylmuramic acid kinase